MKVLDLPERIDPPVMLTFLNAMAFGIICPFLYYIIALPDSIWIAVLIGIDSLGRMAGARVLPLLKGKLGKQSPLLVSQALYAASFGVLMCTAFFKNAHSLSLGIVYVSRFMGAFATAEFPAVRLVMQVDHATFKPRAINASLFGFAVGCAISALPANNHRIVASILETSFFIQPAACGAAISMLAFAVAIRCDHSFRAERPSVTLPEFAVGAITLLAEASFAMTLCILPLMMWETYAFTPARTALFLSLMALIALVSRMVFACLPGISISPARWIMVGLFLATLGFSGFVSSWWISWVAHPFDGMTAGYWLLWFAGAFAAVARGVLQTSLPILLKTHSAQSKSSPGRIRLDELAAIITALAALLAGALWADHERTSFSIPCLLSAAALILAGIKVYTPTLPMADET